MKMNTKELKASLKLMTALQCKGASDVIKTIMRFPGITTKEIEGKLNIPQSEVSRLTNRMKIILKVNKNGKYSHHEINSKKWKQLVSAVSTLASFFDESIKVNYTHKFI